MPEKSNPSYGDSITITILDVSADGARTGIESPGQIPVHCEEVYVRTRAGLISCEETPPGPIVLESAENEGISPSDREDKTGD